MSESERGIQETGVTNGDVAGRVGGVHVLGGLHGHPLTIARLTGSLTRFEPDIVAVEACAEAVSQYHPDVQDACWPPRDELEAAAYVTDRRYDLIIAGIDTQEYEHTVDFERLDREIFTELGVINAPDELTKATYFKLDLPTIRAWRAMTEEQVPDAFTTVLADRDAVMAGHLHALSSDEDINTIVAAVGVQHLTGVLDLLQTPSEIPDDCIEIPPLAHYRLFKRDSPWSSAN